MSQCLRCNKPCAPTTVFCDECRGLLKLQLQQGGTLSPAEQQGLQQVQGDPLERITGSISSISTAALPAVPAPQEQELIPASAPLLPQETHTVDNAISKLNQAAQLIAEEELGSRRAPRASRLSPVRDISGEIQRESTPLPDVRKRSADELAKLSTQPIMNKASTGEFTSNPDLPDLWPWLDMETLGKESDIWANGADPLLSRQFPSRFESARVEEEDMRRALADDITTRPQPAVRRPRRFSRWHMALASLAMVAILALIVDGLLVAFTFNHPHHPPTPSQGVPTLTLSSSTASLGQTVKAHLAHFSANTNVSLMRDVDVSVQVVSGSSVLHVDASGSADATILVSPDWDPGLHLLVAEDITTRYTANASLQVVHAGPSRPPHMLIDKTSLDLGTDIQGAITSQALKMTNTGGGSINWSVSSNQPWLQVSPSQGVFSDTQVLTVAGQRSTLKPGDYVGTITVVSNVGPPQQIQVQMTVRLLPPNAGPVLSLTPAVLSFIATDGVSVPPTSQVLTLSNPGSKTLNWSLAINTPPNASSQAALFHALGANANWLTANVMGGSLPPGAATQITVTSYSQNLLPGSYSGSLVFSASQGAYDSPQTVSVSLTIQPHCGLVSSPGFMSFTAVTGQSNPAARAATLSATSSCAGATLNWNAMSSASWLFVSPASGQIHGNNSTSASIGVNISSLPNINKVYTGFVNFLTGNSTQTVMVQLNVQVPATPHSPILSVSPLSMSFSYIQGQPTPAPQTVTVTNNGGSTMYWNNRVSFVVPWIYGNPAGGVLQPGQSTQVTVGVNTAMHTPGAYTANISIEGLDANNAPASGSPQTVNASLNLQAPCTLAPPSSSVLAFNGMQGGANPLNQTVTFGASGSCSWPVNWTASASSSASWFAIGATSGSIKSDTSTASIIAGVNIGSLSPGVYTTQVNISATDSSNISAGQQSFTIKLTVLQPCALQVNTSGLSFSVAQGQSSSSQSLSLSSSGSCGGSVSWSTSVDSSSSSWLNLQPSSGTDTGSGSSFGVSVAPPNSMIPGNYTGHITISATSSSGSVQNSPQTVNVALTITGYSLSGSVVTCNGPAPTCTTSQAFPGATVTLVVNGTNVASTTADTSGNYSFSNLALGTYTVNVSGTSGSTVYSGSTTLTLSANTSSYTLQAFPPNLV